MALDLGRLLYLASVPMLLIASGGCATVEWSKSGSTGMSANTGEGAAGTVAIEVYGLPANTKRRMVWTHGGTRMTDSMLLERISESEHFTNRLCETVFVPYRDAMWFTAECPSGTLADEPLDSGEYRTFAYRDTLMMISAQPLVLVQIDLPCKARNSLLRIWDRTTVSGQPLVLLPLGVVPTTDIPMCAVSSGPFSAKVWILDAGDSEMARVDLSVEGQVRAGGMLVDWSRSTEHPDRLLFTCQTTSG